MKILKWIGIGLGVGVVVIVVVGFCLPRRFSVKRSVAIEAPPEAVYAVVTRLREWPTWTAWNQERYPDMKITHSGPEQGVGSKQMWEGQSSGNGFLEITTASPEEGITYVFGYDGETSTGGIGFFPSIDAVTLVTWHAEGDFGFNPIARYFGPLMDGFMGPDFEKGLAGLKRKVEAGHNGGIVSQVQEAAAAEKAAP